jgi:hypothetical protein
MNRRQFLGAVIETGVPGSAPILNFGRVCVLTDALLRRGYTD